MKLLQLPQLSGWAVWAWRAVYIPGILLEVSQFIDNDAGDTLSELIVYRMAQSWIFHGAFAGFLIWCMLHWRILSDPSRGMMLATGWWVLEFVAVGVAVRGVVRWWYGW